MNAFDQELTHWLAARDAEGMLRARRTVTRRDGVSVGIDGKEYVSFCSNDYLGLATDPAIREAAAQAARDWGGGAGASRLISGDLAIVRELEDELAAWKGTEAALVFPTGYMANLGVLSALVGREDTIVLDRLAHASLVDGARLSGAKLLVFPHNDVGRLDAVLSTHARGRTIVATESIFSMDGDRAPLRPLVEACERHGALLLVDEAHALGVYGGGRGCVAEEGLTARVPLIIGTLSKALGSQGGFVACARAVVEYLVNNARSFVYTTGITPAAAGGALSAVRLLRADDARIRQLWYNRALLRTALADVPAGGDGPICPVIIGDAARAVALSRRLFDAGWWVPAIRPPTVPQGTARLRITVSAAHTGGQISGMAAVLANLLSH